MTPGQRRAAKRPGVGGKKHGRWPALWRWRHRQVTKRHKRSKRPSKHKKLSVAHRKAISKGLKRHYRGRGRKKH